MKEKFEDITFSPDRDVLLTWMDEKLNEYQKQGYVLSTRQLYYQCVANNLVPNTEKSYKMIASLVSDGRKAGRIDWAMIDDRGRNTNVVGSWDHPADILYESALRFRTNPWKWQPNHVEVVVEKDAMSGILWPVCAKERIPFTAAKGYSSSSLAYEMGQRLRRIHEIGLSGTCGQTVHIIYLGDHDPSGIHMAVDIHDRLCMYSRLERSDLKVHRIALNMDQVHKYRPPENPAKMTDSRYKKYQEKYGDSSWELDSLEPHVIADLVTRKIHSLRDEDSWKMALINEERMRRDLWNVYTQFEQARKAARKS